MNIFISLRLSAADPCVMQCPRCCTTISTSRLAGISNGQIYKYHYTYEHKYKYTFKCKSEYRYKCTYKYMNN